MPRRSFVQINGVLYEKGVDEIPDDAAGRSRGAAVMGDLPDFVSPIDGSVVRGRAGMREHCKKHDVVPTADLKGLPNQRPVHQPDKAGIRDAIRRAVYK